VEEYKGLKIPDLATKEIMVESIKQDVCMMPNNSCPHIDCSDCLTSRQNSQYLKEYLMKDNNIDSNVLAIFGDKVKGNELVVIDRHFTDQMLTRILMEKHHKAIQEACVEAEAKRLEKEEKDK
jgi:hypothetical protein